MNNFDPERIAEYIKPLTDEEIAALTPEQARARLGVLRTIQQGAFTPKQLKKQRQKQKFSARLAARLRDSAKV